jgi:hypothetical protein
MRHAPGRRPVGGSWRGIGGRASDGSQPGPLWPLGACWRAVPKALTRSLTRKPFEHFKIGIKLFIIKWWAVSGSNCGPPACKAAPFALWLTRFRCFSSAYMNSGVLLPLQAQLLLNPTLRVLEHFWNSIRTACPENREPRAAVTERDQLREENTVSVPFL